MILIEKRPNVLSLRKYVDRYQIFVISKPAFVKTIPNCKIECYLIKKGKFTKWDVGTDSFISSSTGGILTSTDKTSIYHVPDNIIFLNIKFNLNILGLSLFDGLLKNWKNFEVADLIPEIEQATILSQIDEENPTIDVNKLDTLIEHSFSRSKINKKIDSTLNLIQDQITNKFRVLNLANSMHMSQKSTERWIQKQFNLTPKKLLQIIRFQHTSGKMKKEPKSKFIDSLEFGYYDQSHFIKECKKITGYSPKIFSQK